MVAFCDVQCQGQGSSRGRGTPHSCRLHGWAEGDTENGVSESVIGNQPGVNSRASIGNRAGCLESWAFIWIYSNWQNSVVLEAKMEKGPHLETSGISHCGCGLLK